MKNTESYDIRKEYESNNRKKIIILIVSIVVMLICGLYFVKLGVADTSFSQVVSAIGCMV